MDPTAPQYDLMEMPNLRALASKSVSFIRHYTNSPQCVPGRVAMFTGRRIDEIKAFGNQMSLVGDYKNPLLLDPACVHYYGIEICRRWSKLQKLNHGEIETS